MAAMIAEKDDHAKRIKGGEAPVALRGVLVLEKVEHKKFTSESKYKYIKKEALTVAN